MQETKETVVRLGENCKRLYRALYNMPWKSDIELHNTVSSKEDRVALFQAFELEIKRLLANGAPHGGGNWAKIITLSYGIDANNPKCWTDEELARKFDCKKHSITVQKRTALDHLSTSQLLGEFLVGK